MTNAQRQIGEEFIASRLDAPFRWGQNDCGLFVADFLLAVTGVDYAEPVRGKYIDAVGAIKAFNSIPVSGIVGFMEWTAARYHWEPVTMMDAQWGDVGILRNARDSACIVIGADVISTGHDRLIAKPRSIASQLWRAR